MTRLRLSPDAPWQSGGYSSAAHTAWLAGEVREVTEAQAAYLTATFPGLFVPAGLAVEAAVVEAHQPSTDPAPGSLAELAELVDRVSAAHATAKPHPKRRG